MNGIHWHYQTNCGITYLANHDQKKIILPKIHEYNDDIVNLLIKFINTGYKLDFKYILRYAIENDSIILLNILYGKYKNTLKRFSSQSMIEALSYERYNIFNFIISVFPEIDVSILEYIIYFINSDKIDLLNHAIKYLNPVLVKNVMKIIELIINKKYYNALPFLIRNNIVTKKILYEFFYENREQNIPLINSLFNSISYDELDNILFIMELNNKTDFFEIAVRNGNINLGRFLYNYFNTQFNESFFIELLLGTCVISLEYYYNCFSSQINSIINSNYIKALEIIHGPTLIWIHCNLKNIDISDKIQYHQNIYNKRFSDIICLIDCNKIDNAHSILVSYFYNNNMFDIINVNYYYRFLIESNSTSLAIELYEKYNFDNKININMLYFAIINDSYLIIKWLLEIINISSFDNVESKFIYAIFTCCSIYTLDFLVEKYHLLSIFPLERSLFVNICTTNFKQKNVSRLTWLKSHIPNFCAMFPQMHYSPIINYYYENKIFFKWICINLNVPNFVRSEYDRYLCIIAPIHEFINKINSEIINDTFIAIICKSMHLNKILYLHSIIPENNILSNLYSSIFG